MGQTCVRQRARAGDEASAPARSRCGSAAATDRSREESNVFHSSAELTPTLGGGSRRVLRSSGLVTAFRGRAA